MTSSAPQQLQGSQSPNSLEAFWDRNRGTVKVAFWIIVVLLAAYYSWQYYEQQKKDAKWSAVSASLLLEETYVPDSTAFQNTTPNSMLQRWSKAVADAPLDTLRARRDTAEDAERPYIDWLIANALFRAEEFDQAEAAARQMLTDYPNHPLCIESGFPVQFRPTKPKSETEDKKIDLLDHDETYLPPVAGSTIGALLQDIAKAKSFEQPASWSKPEVPADAPRYKITLSDFGDITIALMTEQAPKHCEVFEKLAAENHWDGIRVDEIQRPADNPNLPDYPGRQFHFGYTSTKDQADRSKWDTTTPSEEGCVVEDEYPGLSNFPGAVAASFASEKSEVDRIWICGDDRADQDDYRQVFAYVVDGMDVVEEVCGTDFEKLEDASSGSGRPDLSIVIESVSKVE